MLIRFHSPAYHDITMFGADGKLMIEQHRLVMGIFQAEIDSGEVHALTLKTYSPAQYEKAGRPQL